MPHFFDTNTLLYFTSGEAEKADRVATLMKQGGWISVQVFNEAARVMITKWKQDWPLVRQALSEFHLVFDIAPVDIETHRIGLDIAERYKIGIYDSMIAAVALLSGCDTLYSEDFHHGLVVEGKLTVVNPFRT